MCFAGLRTVAFDGLNSLKVPDTDRNRAWIGRIRFRIGFAGYPTLRLMALAETGTRGLLGATLGSASDRDEANLARRLLPLLRPGMLPLLDRAFDGNAFLAEVHAIGAMLSPAPALPATPRVLRHLPDGSCLSSGSAANTPLRQDPAGDLPARRHPRQGEDGIDSSGSYLDWVITRPAALTEKPATGDVRIFSADNRDKVHSITPLGPRRIPGRSAHQRRPPQTGRHHRHR